MARTADDAMPRRRNGKGGATASAHGFDDARAGRDARDGGADDVNVNGFERLLSVAAGGALAYWAWRKRDLGGLAIGVVGGALVERGVTGHCHVYGAMGLTSADEPGEPARQHGRAATVDARKATKIERAVTIYGRTPAELYTYWRNLENLPRIFAHLESVTEFDTRRSRWTAKAPAGFDVQWDAEIVNEVPGEIIGWKSLPGARVPNAGSVHFREAPGGRGTEVRVVLDYEPPAGKLGVAVARMFGEEPAIQVREDLRRYKALMESGELPVSEIPGQGKRARTQFDAQVNRGATGGDVRELQDMAARDAHPPTHVPAPADVQRGTNTTDITDPNRTAEARA